MAKKRNKKQMTARISSRKLGCVSQTYIDSKLLPLSECRATSFVKKNEPGPDEVNVYPCAKEKAKCVSLFEDEETSNNVKREGSRASITELTRKSSNRMKYVLSNSSCDFQGLIM